jgi:molecular chaperone HtpG
MSLELPPRFRDKLTADGRDARLFATIATALAEYSEWLDHSRTAMPLFPDFTDHGVRHLQAILDFAEFLIPDGSAGTPKTWGLVTATDLGLLVLATLAHDAGMYLDEAAFLALIRETPIIVRGVDTQSWAALWEEFFARACRWDGVTRTRIFGTALNHIGPTRREIRRPPEYPEQWDELDRRLAGEYIREHHARLGHEIAVRGWPTTSEIPRGQVPPLQIAATYSDLSDLTGIIARSHGMAIRSVLPHIEGRYSNTLEVSDAHPAYVMALLRIADYVNLDAWRAPAMQLALRALATPDARREWGAHGAIGAIRRDAERDPEAIGIEVRADRVPNMETLDRLAQWEEGIQRELDTSWAVLGELYGRHDRLRGLGLRIRRITSNLASDGFRRALSFVPIRARVTADPDLVSLLVRPLYDSPQVGVRELVQNAVDAVRERRDLATHYGSADAALPPEVLDPLAPGADVVVRLVDRQDSTPTEAAGGPPLSWTSWIEVVDRGIGMTPEIVQQYFLVAGASYRKSDAWRSFHELPGEESADDRHRVRSRVLRSGRFGIGALAPFLLGDEIDVLTRHATRLEEEGLRFLVTLTGSSVHIVPACHRVGTTIRVRLRPDNGDDGHRRRWRLLAQWYYLDDPTVRYFENNNDLEEDTSKQVPQPKSALPPGWRRIQIPGFEDVQWTYLRVPELLCNGIRVGPERDWRTDREGDWKFGLTRPNLSIFDPDGHLPLDLTRSRLNAPEYPFEAELREAVIRDYLAYVLVHAPTRPFRGGSAFVGLLRHRYPGWSRLNGLGDALPWVTLSEGITIPDPFLLLWAEVDRVLVVVRHYRARKIPGFDHRSTGAVFGFNDDGGKYSGDRRMWPLEISNFAPGRQENPLHQLPVTGARALIARSVPKTSRRSSGSGTTPALEGVAAEAETKMLLLWRTGHVPETSVLQQLLQRPSPNANAHELASLVEWYLGRPREPVGPSPLSTWWKDIIGRPCIPFDRDERRTLLADAFRELKAEVQAWERYTMRENYGDWVAEGVTSS